MSEHTPAPWHLSVNGLVIKHDEIPIAEIIFGGISHQDIGRANACLIAAAPTLLETLEELVGALEADEAAPDGSEHYWVRSMMNTAHAAIAKAKGEL